MKKILIVALFAIASAFSEMGFGACGMALTASAVNITWSMGITTISVPMTITKADAPACQYGIGITKGSAANYTSRAVQVSTKSLLYQVYSSAALTNIVKDKPDITAATDVITGSFTGGKNQTANVNYYVSIPYSSSAILPPAGIYTDTYTINLYEGADPMTFGTPVSSASVTITVTVNNMIQLSLVDTGGSFTLGSTNRNINFGTLSEGMSNSLDMIFRTNSGFSVTFSSTNNGRMKHTTPTKNSFVPYTIYLNNSPLNLSASSTSPVVVLTGSGQTTQSGVSYPMKIIIGSFSIPGAVSGTHSDSVTITAVTTE